MTCSVNLGAESLFDCGFSIGSEFKTTATGERRSLRGVPLGRSLPLTGDGGGSDTVHQRAGVAGPTLSSTPRPKLEREGGFQNGPSCPVRDRPVEG